MVWTTAGTNRVCGRCMELKDTVVGYTDQSGVTLPPLHPRCRCAIMYREVSTPRAMQPKPKSPPTVENNPQTISPQENAIVYDNGKRNGYTVNFSLMNTKTYHDRFEKLTEHKAVNEALYKQAVKILGNRSGSEYEELIALDTRTGALLAHNTDAVDERAFQCGLSQAQADALAKNGKAFLLLHNHPNSSYPSTADITSLFARQLQVGSVIVCHNGTIYHITKLKPFDEIKELVMQTRAVKTEELAGYPEHMIELRVAKEVVRLLTRKGVIKFKGLT